MRLLSLAAGEMTSLSRLIKSQWTGQALDEKKIISIKIFQPVEGENPSHEMIQIDAKQREIMEKAREEAAMIVNEASLRAQSIQAKISQEKEAWEQEKLALIEAAQEAGFQTGMAQGQEQGYKECEQAINDAKAVVDAAKRDYQQQIASAEKTILHLGMKTAERILGKKLEDSEETFLAIVERALKEARDYREIQLHVCPSHYAFMLTQKDELMAIFPKETELFIYPDDQLGRGNCIIESANGRIDATIDSQLQEIKSKLLEFLEGETQ